MGKLALAEYRAKREGRRPGPPPGRVAGTSSDYPPPRLARFFALIVERDLAGLPWPSTLEFAEHMGWDASASEQRRVMLQSCLDRGWIVRQGDSYAVVGANLAAHLIRLGWRPDQVAKPAAGR